MPDMLPVPGGVHVDRLMTNMAIKYTQEETVFIAGRVFPQVPVIKKSDFYLKFLKGFFMRDEMQVRPLGGRPRRTGYGTEKGHYDCEEWGLEHPIDDRVRENADVPIEPDMRGTELLTEKALIHRDAEWSAKFFKTGLWGTDWTFPKTKSSEENVSKREGAKFTNYAGVVGNWDTTPVRFFDERATEMREKTGKRPNKLVLGAVAYTVLKNHPEILQRILYTQSPPAIVTPGIMAALFDVEEVLIAEAVQNTAQEGEADKIEFIVDTKSAMLVYAAPAPSIQIPSAGYTFAWTGLMPGVPGAWGGVIERGREALAHTDILQIRATYDMQVTASDLGMFFSKLV